MNRLRILGWKEWRDQRAALGFLALALPLGVWAMQTVFMRDFAWDRAAFWQWLLPLASGLAGVVLGAELSTSDAATPGGELLARSPMRMGPSLAVKLSALILGVALLAGWVVLLQELAWSTGFMQPSRSSEVGYGYDPLPVLWAGVATGWAFAFGALLRSGLRALLLGLSLPALGLWALNLKAHIAIGAMLVELPPSALWGPAILAPVAVGCVAQRRGQAAQGRRWIGALIAALVVLGPAGVVAKAAHRSVAQPELGDARIDRLLATPDERYVLACVSLKWYPWRSRRQETGRSRFRGHRWWLLDSYGQEPAVLVDQQQAYERSQFDDQAPLWGRVRRSVTWGTNYELTWREDPERAAVELPTQRQPVCLEAQGQVLLIDDWGRLVRYDATSGAGRVLLTGLSAHARLAWTLSRRALLHDVEVSLWLDAKSGAPMNRIPAGWQLKGELLQPAGLVVEPKHQISRDARVDEYRYRLVDDAGEVEWSFRWRLERVTRVGSEHYAALINGGVVLLDREGHEVRELAPTPRSGGRR